MHLSISYKYLKIKNIIYHTNYQKRSDISSFKSNFHTLLVKSSIMINSKNQNKEISEMITKLKKCQLLSLEQLKQLCSKAQQIFSKQDNLILVRSPITICGDIHGQFSDLMELFQIGGPIPSSNYLFLGDYVDRGYHSVEVICLLLAFKVKHPNRIHLLRGNHQSRTIGINYGFYDECNRKYGNVMAWKLLNQVFDCLPLSALVQGTVLCMHGGLSPSITALDQINKINRINQPMNNESGPMIDLLWSDPCEYEGWHNSPRGAGYLFGSNCTHQFSHNNNLKMITRAHQLVMSGYERTHNDEVMTIFSAPNYCYKCNNQAAMMQYDQNMQHSPEQQTFHTESRRVPDYFL